MKMNTMKQWLTSIVFSLMAVFAQASLVEQTPYVLMQKVSDQLFTDIRENQSKIKQDPNYLRTIVRNDLLPHVHVKYAGSLVLGQNFKATTEEQREKFFDAFGLFIEQAYAQVLTSYTDQQIHIEQPKTLTDQNLVNVRVNLLQNNGKAPTKLDFKWRKNSKTGQWQAYDMVAEGVSMVDTKKNEWAGILRQQGIDALTVQIRKSAGMPVTLNK